MTPWQRTAGAWLLHAGLPARIALAGAVGALWDEHWRAGFSTWQSLCRSGQIGLLDPLAFYAQLMPWSTIAILTTALVSLLAATAQTCASARSSLFMHAACWIAMPASIIICSRIVSAGTSGDVGLASMFLLDFVLMLTATSIWAWRMRPGQELNLRPLA